MLVFYNIGIRLYHLGVLIASIFNPKAKLWIDGRNGLLQKIEQEVSDFSGETIWVHCASLGEFEMARPIMEGIKNSSSDSRIILTFFSPSGFEIRKKYALAEHVFYLPLDTASNAERFVRAIKPTKTIFVKYDLWFHHLNAAKKAGSELMLISAQFRENQSYFKFYGGVGRDALKLFDQTFLVDTNSEKLLHQIDIKKTTVCGDTRYDRVTEIASTSKSNKLIEAFKGESQLIVCGSTWQPDEEVIKMSLDSFTNVKWIIVPHEVGDANLKRIENLFLNTIRYSKLDSQSSSRIVIVDSIGILNTLYKYANVAYVGGAFKTGLHNILEATAYGVPTVFGPDYSQFADAGELVAANLAFSIKNEQELKKQMATLLNDDQKKLSSSILEFMKKRTGASEAILEYTNKC